MADKTGSLLQQAHAAMDAAVATYHADPEAALDDLLAARLLIATALVTLGVPFIT